MSFPRPAASVTPLWLRAISWPIITAVTVAQAPTVLARVLAGVSVGVGAVALQFVDTSQPRVRQAAVVLGTAGGVAGCLASHDGLAPVLVVIAAGRIPDAFTGRGLRWFVVADTLAFAATIAFISRSVIGALAGAGIPLMAQRALERVQLVRERDLARALLAEVQGKREAEAQAAALRERGRIARELHDVLAHTLAGLSVQLQAVRAVAAREAVPPVVLEPLDNAARLAADGLGEAREAVAALREPTGLGLAELPALVTRHPGEALFDVVGEPGEVGGETGHAIYRMVQESLTNAARYAPGSPVRVQLHWHPDSLDVTVADDGAPPGRSPVAGQGTGLGLAGMAERFALVGGTLQAGPDGAGWRVMASVPALRSALPVRARTEAAR